MFGPNESDEAVRDNASGAVARMIMAQPHAIPFSQVVQYRYRFVGLILLSKRQKSNEVFVNRTKRYRN